MLTTIDRPTKFGYLLSYIILWTLVIGHGIRVEKIWDWDKLFRYNFRKALMLQSGAHHKTSTVTNSKEMARQNAWTKPWNNI